MAATKKKKVSIHIPEDLAFSILSKLPLKSLKRFTCVRKSWSLLFENPHFMNMFRSHFISKHHSFYDDTCLLLRQRISRQKDTLYMVSGERFDFEDRVKLDWPPPFQVDTSFIHILGTCSVNGTLCLYRESDITTIVLLWNPATEQFKVIPQSCQPYDNIEFNRPPQGFGYDRVRDDYKVIRSVLFPREFEDNWVYVPNKASYFWETDKYLDDRFWERLVVDMYDPFWEIYSLRSNSWKKLDGVDMPIPWPSSFEVNLNEVCHWLGPQGDMVSFDFTNEKFFATTLPSDLTMIYKWVSITLLVVLNGSVGYICEYDRTTCFYIWILGELGVNKSWTKLFVVGPLTCVRYPIITAWKNGNIFFIKEDGKLFWFDLSTQGIEEIGVEGGSVWQTVIYKKNLLPIEE